VSTATEENIDVNTQSPLPITIPPPLVGTERLPNGDRRCRACDRVAALDEPDPCLGRIGHTVVAACCGHGDRDFGGYVMVSEPRQLDLAIEELALPGRESR
jgi:hypothetical protein